MRRWFRSGPKTESLSVIVYFELRRNLRSFRFLVSGALLTLLVALAVWVGLADYRLRLEAYEAKLQDPGSSLAFGNVYSSLQPIVSKKPNPLAIFERGVDGQEGTEVRITVVEVPTKATGRHRGNPYLSRLVGLDVTTVIKLVLGLGALLLTFDSMVGSQSRFRAEVLLAHGATSSEILIGKILAVLGSLVVSLVFALGPVTVWLLAVGVLGSDVRALAYLGGLFGAYLAYGLTMALVGLAISLRAPTVARSLIYATFTWFILVVLLPLSLTAGVTAIADMNLDPLAVEEEVERLEVEKAAELQKILRRDPIRVLTSGHRSVSNTVGENGAVLRRFGSPAFNDSLARYFVEEVRLGRLYAERIHGLRLRAQRESASWLQPLGWMAAVLPGQLLDQMASTMAGTTSADHQRFVESAQTYRQIFLAYLERKGAVGSWRWFTDDPEQGMPWTTFFGVQPEEVTRENIGEAIRRWGEEDIQAEAGAAVRDRLRDDPRFDVSDLPVFQPDYSGGAGRRWMATGASLIMVGIFWLLVLDSARHSRVLYPSLGAMTPPTGPDSSAEIPFSQRVVRSAFRRWAIGQRSIFWAELLGIVRQLKWRATCLLVIATMMMGASIFAVRFQTLTADQDRERAAYEQHLEGKSLAELLTVHHQLLRPAWSLGFLIDGGERLKPSVYRLPLTTWFRPELTIPPMDLLRLSKVPAPDWSFVLRVVLSLVAFFLGYDALAGRQLSRCRAQLAAGASLSRIAVAKGFALWTALALPFLLGGGLSLGVLVFHGLPIPSGQDLAKLAVFMLIGMWALMLYVLITLVVSAWLGTAEKALVTLILLWISAVSVIPSAAGILVMRLEPLTTEWQLQTEMNDIRKRAEAKEGAGSFRRMEWGWADGFAAEKRAAEIHRQRRSEQEILGRHYVKRQLEQSELAEKLACLSPMGLFQHTLQSFLGAGIYRQYAFVGQTQEFEPRLSMWARSLDADDPESPHLAFFPRYFSRRPVAAESVPRFEFREIDLREGFERALVPLLILALLTIALAGFLPWIVEHRLANEKGRLE